MPVDMLEMLREAMHDTASLEAWKPLERRAKCMKSDFIPKEPSSVRQHLQRLSDATTLRHFRHLSDFLMEAQETTGQCYAVSSEARFPRFSGSPEPTDEICEAHGLVRDQLQYVQTIVHELFCQQEADHRSGRLRSDGSRWIRRQDVVQILNLQDQGGMDPLSEEDFYAWMSSTGPGMVHEINDRIAGLFRYALGDDHIEIPELVVHPDFRRKGIAARIFEKMRCKIVRGKKFLRMLVRERSLAAQQYLRDRAVDEKGRGFRVVETVPHAYPDTGEDGYIFQYPPPAGPDKS